MLCPLGQADSLQRLPRPRDPLAPAHPLINQRQLHIFLRSQLGNQIEILKNEADLAVPDPGKLVFGIVVNGDPVEAIDSRIGGIQAADDVHEGGFTAAGGADHTDKFMGVNMHRGMVQRAHPLIADGVDLADVFQIDHGAPPQPTDTS